MKKFLKSLMGATLSICMVFSIAGCGGEASPEQVMKTAIQKMEKASSFESETVFDEKMSMGAESDDYKMTVAITSFRNPVKNKTEMTTESSEETQTTEMYIEKVDGNAKLYSNAGGRWYQRTLDEEELQSFLSEGDVTLYLNAVTKLENVGTEEVNGKNTTKYSGAVVGEDMKKIGDGSMIDSFIIAANITEEQAYERIGDIPVFIYIDEQGYPIKFEIDMKNMMQAIWDVSRESVLSEYEIYNDMTIDTMTMTLTYQNINNATDFEIPEEAKNAVEW